MFLTGLHCHMVEAGEDLPQLEDALDRMFEEHKLEASLADLSKKGVIERHETAVTRGPNFGVDNGPWLRYRFLNDFVADAACAAPVRGGQCDSCKRRPFESQDESYVLILHSWILATYGAEQGSNFDTSSHPPCLDVPARTASVIRAGTISLSTKTKTMRRTFGHCSFSTSFLAHMTQSLAMHRITTPCVEARHCGGWCP